MLNLQNSSQIKLVEKKLQCLPPKYYFFKYKVA